MPELEGGVGVVVEPAHQARIEAEGDARGAQQVGHPGEEALALRAQRGADLGRVRHQAGVPLAVEQAQRVDLQPAPAVVAEAIPERGVVLDQGGPVAQPVVDVPEGVDLEAQPADAQNALGGGGRYDGLAEVLGFPSVPGSGYALGVERTLAVCRQQGLGPAPRRDRVVVLGVGPTDAPAAARVARELRAAGVAAVLDASERRLDRRLATAARQGAPGRGAGQVGAEEAATWKDLDTGRQEETAGGLGWRPRSAACSPPGSQPRPRRTASARD